MALLRCSVASLAAAAVLALSPAALAEDYKVKVTPAPAASPAPAPAASPAPAPPATDSKGGGAPAAKPEAGDPSADADKSTGNVGGYSWGSTPRGKAPAARRPPRVTKQYDRNTPIVTYPGFRIVPDGSTLIWVQVSKTVPVREEVAKGQVSYLLEGAHVQIYNNTNSLVTTYFQTPVAATRLREGDAGVRLVVELREDVQPTHEVVAGPRGTMLVRVRVPPQQGVGQSSGGAAATPVAAGSMASTQPDPEPKFDVRADAEASASASVSLTTGKAGKKHKRHKKSRK